MCSPPGDPVLDGYYSNSGSHVTAADARALAKALEKALPDLPGHDALAPKTFEDPRLAGERFLRRGTPVTPFEWFSGANKEHLKGFIALCRQGGFEIW